jgi:LPXTG-site transpeptidase (sortase) family protein
MKTHSKSIFNIFTLFALLASLIGSAVFVTPAYAATFTVTDCGDSGAAGQLRTLMNAAASGDTINIPACTITITGASGEDLNASGDLDFTKSLTLVGAGAGSAIINGGALDRVFHVTGAFTVNISGVTVTNGNANLGGGILNNSGGILTVTNSTFSSNAANFGGGVTNNGVLSLTGNTFSNNIALSSGGGVYHNGDPTTIITNNTFSGNAAADSGGGIYNNATLTVTNSPFSNNSANNNGGGGIYNSPSGKVTITNSAFSSNSTIANNGGGIHNNSGTVTITNSAFSGNSANSVGAGGGGILNFAGALTITNSAFSGNSARFAGGGIYNSLNSSATITNSTFSGNSANSLGGGGGGIYNSSASVVIINSTFSENSTSAPLGGGVFNSSGTMTLKNTIVHSLLAAGGNCGGTITDGGNNLDSANSCLFTVNAIINTNPNLGGLANNGGPTQTMALISPSPAIDAGNATTCANSPVSGKDQRGVARPIDGDAVLGAVCDIGAYEYGDTIPPTVIAKSLVASYTTTGPSSFTVTFSENVNDPFGNTDPADVTNPANYLVVNKGANGVADTVSCLAGLAGDDTQATVSGVTYSPNTAVVTLASALPIGSYRLFVCGTTSIADLALNKLNGGLSDYTFDFVVVAAVGGGGGGGDEVGLPRTGFAPNAITILPPQPADRAYTKMSALWLEIPSLKIKTNIVGVPQSQNIWDVQWLGNDVGWLNGTAFPTWTGNSVLTGHVTNADGLPGPFAKIKSLNYGDQIIVHLGGQKYIFEVRNSLLVRPETTNYALEHLVGNSYLTLITCQGYSGEADVYRFRRIVRAVLVGVK